jgi:nicotinamidase-related amidase
VKGSSGAEIANGLVVQDGDYKLVKTRFSSFFATPLDSVLKASGIKNLVVVGKALMKRNMFNYIYIYYGI